MAPRDAVTTILSAPPVSSVARWSTRRRLRILAYHSVTDAARFAAQMSYVAERMTPLSLADVIRAHGEGRWPANGVWTTFDDGDPSVVERAMPVLKELGLSATMFICPGVVDGDEPFWWERVPTNRVPALKRAADEVRRSEAAAMPREPRRQVTMRLLDAWVTAGHTLGNHTFDHPVLDTCSEDEQARQIGRAHEWLRDLYGVEATRAFAYPNGTWTEWARRVLRGLGYEVAVLFDHRLADVTQDALALSRLRIDADAPASRARAILSGGHPAAFRLLRGTRG